MTQPVGRDVVPYVGSSVIPLVYLAVPGLMDLLVGTPTPWLSHLQIQGMNDVLIEKYRLGRLYRPEHPATMA